MKNALLLLILVVPFAIAAQSPPANIQEAATGSLMYSEGRVTQLADAIPADTYDWRPAEGVRSVAESMLHLAAANYMIFMTAGNTPPEVDVMTLEQSTSEKEEVIAAVKASYEYARNAIAGMTAEELGEIVEFPFPGKFNKRSALIIASGHAEEHMGQLVAYARMNGIVPPWSE